VLHWPLLAVSGLSNLDISNDANVRFREKQTLSLRLPKLNRKTSALRSEADIQLILTKGAANDPKRPPTNTGTCGRFSGVSKLMRSTTFAILCCLVSHSAVSQDSNIVGKWAVRDAEYPTNLVFDSDGTFKFESPGVVYGVTCTYSFDTTGSPNELTLRCSNEKETANRRLWVVFLAESVIHFRGQELNGPTTDLNELVDITLDKIDD